MSFFPSCEAVLPAEKYDFVDVFDRAVRGTRSGGVLVMASNGYPDASLCGGTKLSRVRGAGLAGVLTDGRVRDFEELAGYDMAVYCSGEALYWGGDTVTPFEVNRPVVGGGVGVRPGDHVFADGSGAVLIPREQVREVLEDAVRTKESEARLAAEWRAGAHR
jgi:regulator of RNase E activity RraA